MTPRYRHPGVGTELLLPVFEGSEGEKAIDISTLPSIRVSDA